MAREIFNKTDLEMDEASTLLHLTAPVFSTAPEIFMAEWNANTWAKMLSDGYQLICVDFVEVWDDHTVWPTKTFFPMFNTPFNQKSFVKEFGLAAYKAQCEATSYLDVDAFHVVYIFKGIVTCISYILDCDHPAIYEQDIFEVKMEGLQITEIKKIEDSERELFKPSLLKYFQVEREKFEDIATDEEIAESETANIEYRYLPRLIERAEKYGSFMLCNEYFLPHGSVEFVPNHGFYLYEQGDDESLEHLLAKGPYDWQAAFAQIESLPEPKKSNVMDNWVFALNGPEQIVVPEEAVRIKHNKLIALLKSKDYDAFEDCKIYNPFVWNEGYVVYDKNYSWIYVDNAPVVDDDQNSEDADDIEVIDWKETFRSIAEMEEDQRAEAQRNWFIIDTKNLI